MKSENIGWIVLGAFVVYLLIGRQVQRVSNAETWNWIDYKGNERQMVIHRNVEAS
jgi:hypothetical protein